MACEENIAELKTPRTEISGDQIWRIDVLRARAEKAFRAVQSPLAAWPIFHQHEHARGGAHSLSAFWPTICRASKNPTRPEPSHLGDPARHLSKPMICTIVLLANNGSGRRVRKARAQKLVQVS